MLESSVYVYTTYSVLIETPTGSVLPTVFDGNYGDSQENRLDLIDLIETREHLAVSFKF